jgi:hypothetical protein
MGACFLFSPFSPGKDIKKFLSEATFKEDVKYFPGIIFLSVFDNWVFSASDAEKKSLVHIHLNNYNKKPKPLLTKIYLYSFIFH